MQFWKVQMFPTATPIPLPATSEPEVGIADIVIKNAQHQVVQAVDGIYTLKIDETVTITVDYTHHPDHQMEVIWTTGYGKVPFINEKTNTYTATKLGSDYVLIRIWDKTVGEKLVESIDIAVVP